MLQGNRFKTSFVNAMSKYIQNTTYLGDIMKNGLGEITNPKWLDFEGTGIRRKEALVNNSASRGLMRPDMSSIPPTALGGRFNPFANVLYASLDATKANRIYEYRLMASYPEVTDAIEEISNSFINIDGYTHLPAKFTYRDRKASLDCLTSLDEEFEYFINLFNFRQNGKKYCTDFLVDGELYLELVICNDTPATKAAGILGTLKLQTELMETVYKDKNNGLIGAFVGKAITYDPSNPQHITNMEYIPYEPNEIFYVTSNNWDCTGEYVVPFIERARKRYIQLSYLEDAIIIYRLVRAPERLVFTVDTTNMNTPDAEAYLQELRGAYWKSKTFDINIGDITQKFEPQSMLDAFWIAAPNGQDSVKINQLAGGQNLGQLDDLNYFIRALYRALHVPSSRLDPQAQSGVDDSQILQEELKFAELIISIQNLFAEALKQAFITHLKFKGIYQKYKLRENLMDIEFYPPRNYFKMRALQTIQIEGNAFSALAQNDCFSKTMLMKHIMGWNNDDILTNMRLRKIEAGHEWEIQQISGQGPNWKQMQLAQMAGALGQGSEGGGDMGGEGADMGGDMGGDFGGDMGGEEMGGAVDDAMDAMGDGDPGADMEPI